MAANFAYCQIEAAVFSKGSCRAVSHMASQENARLKALQSLKTLASVARLSVDEGLQTDALTLIEGNLRPCEDPAQQPEASTSDFFSCRDLNLAVALEIAQVFVSYDFGNCQQCQQLKQHVTLSLTLDFCGRHGMALEGID